MSIFDTLKKGKKKEFSLEKSDSVRHDWVIALGIFFLAIVAVVAFNGYIFLHVDREVTPAAVGTGSNRSIIDIELLNKTIDFYANKKEHFDMYQEEAPSAPGI